MRVQDMGRTAIQGTPMTPAERQRRRRAKLCAERKLHCAETVLAALDRDYCGASATDRDMIRKGVARLLRQWEREAARLDALWRRKRRR
jgi:hypothetical protein